MVAVRLKILNLHAFLIAQKWAQGSISLRLIMVAQKGRGPTFNLYESTQHVRNTNSLAAEVNFIYNWKFGCNTICTLSHILVGFDKLLNLLIILFVNIPPNYILTWAALYLYLTRATFSIQLELILIFLIVLSSSSICYNFLNQDI